MFVGLTGRMNGRSGSIQGLVTPAFSRSHEGSSVGRGETEEHFRVESNITLLQVEALVQFNSAHEDNGVSRSVLCVPFP